MYTLDDILNEGSKFQNRMFISLPQFLYCSCDEVYFPKLSCLYVADVWYLLDQTLSASPPEYYCGTVG